MKANRQTTTQTNNKHNQSLVIQCSKPMGNTNKTAGQMKPVPSQRHIQLQKTIYILYPAHTQAAPHFSHKMCTKKRFFHNYVTEFTGERLSECVY